MKHRLLIFIIFLSSFSFSQAIDFMPYYLIDLDSGNYESIVQVSVYYGDTSGYTSTGFRYSGLTEKYGNVGYESDSQGYGFYTESVDTFYLLYELHNILDSGNVRCDTIRTINRGIVFTNPYPDFYLRQDGELQDPYLIMYFAECHKTHADCRAAATRMYTHCWDKSSTRFGCILNDENGTVYQYTYSDGSTRSMGYFRNGLPVGIWYFFSETGELKSTYSFDN